MWSAHGDGEPHGHRLGLRGVALRARVQILRRPVQSHRHPRQDVRQESRADQICELKTRLFLRLPLATNEWNGNIKLNLAFTHSHFVSIIKLATYNYICKRGFYGLMSLYF